MLFIYISNSFPSFIHPDHLFPCLGHCKQCCDCVRVHTHTCVLSCVQLFATTYNIACQTPLSMEFSRQEYWNGWQFPSPRDLQNPGIEAMSPISPALTGEPITRWETRAMDVRVQISVQDWFCLLCVRSGGDSRRNGEMLVKGLLLVLFFSH